MIARCQYTANGFEPQESGQTVVYGHPASGYVMIDVIVNGYSKNFDIVTVDNTYGKVLVPGVLAKGDFVQFIYKQTPGFNEEREFSASDFSNSEFA